MSSGAVLSPVSSPLRTSRWNAVRLFGYRLAGSYLVIYSLPPNLPPQMVPGLGWMINSGVTFWHAVLSWVGRHIVHINNEAPPNGFLPGDTTFGVIRVACCLVLAIAAALIWTLMDRNGNTRQARNWVRVYLRYVLSLAMLGYGLAKVIEVQYPPLELDKMLRPIGDLTPMGLLWTFMQGSRIYTLFAGVIEVTGASLLLFRRTTTLGALLTTASLVNVVVINFGYDVAVKLYSTHLLLMALFLLAPDVARLADMLVLNRPVMPRKLDMDEPFRHAWARYSKLAVKVLIVGIALFGLTSSNLERAKWFGQHARPPVYGVYNVEEFRHGDQVVPPLRTGGTEWRNAVFQAMGPAGRSWLSIQMADDSWQQYRTEYDSSRSIITVTDGSGRNKKGTLSYGETGDGQLVLTGTLNGQPLSTRLKRVDDSRFLLLRRDFHFLQPHGNQVFQQKNGN